jgi:hypothetical protein
MAGATWDIDPAKFVNVAENDLLTMVRIITLDAFGVIIRMSPVDTGRYRGNHRLTIGSPSDATTNNTGLGNQSEAQSKIAGLQVPYTTVYIQNGLPYAEALENGSSTQAPAGIYETTFNSMAQKYGR